MNLNLSLLRAISLWPDNEAIADGQVKFTYKELGQRVAALAASISKLGVEEGDVIACLAPNCHEYLELYYAASFLGVVLNPLNFRLSPAELAEILNDSKARVIFSHHDFEELARKTVHDSKDLTSVVWLGKGQSADLGLKSHKYEPLLMSEWGAELPDREAQSSDLAQLYYTSGTTGQSKGVMLTHENAANNALGAVCELNLTESDCWAHIAPMFHLVDAWSVWAVTWVGGKHVFVPYFKPQDVLPVLERENVTITALVPTMLATLISSPNSWEYSYKSLRLIMTAGSPISPDLVRQVSDTFQSEYVQFYGMTETSPFLTISLPMAIHRGLPETRLQQIRATTGRPFIGVEVKVVRENDQPVAADGQEVGEIIARGPSVTQGYWNKPDITALTIRKGWIYTGDLAVLDEEGYINIVDRKKDMIITGGENVYSTEVEHVLYDHPAVFECAVLGVPDEQWGEAIKAVVVLHSGQEASEAEIIEHVREKLAGYKAPKSVDFVKELPKTGSGKIYKKGIREKYWTGHTTRVH